MQTGVQRSASAAGDLVCKPPLSCCQRMRDPAGRHGLAGQSACCKQEILGSNPSGALEGVLEHHLGLSGFLSENGMQTGVQSSASAAGDLVANHLQLAGWRRGLVGKAPV